ncbi:hypothetical protein FANTH_1849 [Fusarium anthophilum]|uniref:Uncharacterized protein n=1 Tax=Fusarium anthophilum TaxID=48485 RepID=A0A8H4ZUZ0_9HYPO|nr:hypothetical protein FANTH_1849 [Fusarium anthophilum]
MNTTSISRKRRFSDSVVQCCRSPISSKSASPIHSPPSPWPLRFGFELETMIRPKSSTGINVPGDTSVAEQRRFGFRLLATIARALNEGGFPSTVFDPNEDDKPNYSVWNVMLDGSLSKRHQRDGYYPVEIVSPVMDADMDGKWSELVDKLWRTLLQSFEFRGLANLFATIESLDRNDIVDLISPSKFYAWNFLPSRTDGHGSIEFRRPPGVIGAKKTKHWIAFTLAFV